MSNSVENIELIRFHESLMQDLKSTQLSEDEGGTREQIFTQLAMDLLAEAGETENVRVAYDEGQLGTRNQHKINAYAEPDNYETIDLFVTIFKGTDEPTRVPKDEVDTAAKRIANFYRKAKNKGYVNEIEESSHIWDFAHTLSTSDTLNDNLVRINAIILTDGYYLGEVPAGHDISGNPIFFRVIDINYLYNISKKSHIPIEIDFRKEGFSIPCIPSPSENDQYRSYLAIIPGNALALIYERYGSRLLEQNVRAFLQFTGKINKGIRDTIKNEPHMFLAFNNGIAATAESLEIDKAETGHGLVISKVKDFQIVNGGQTTASIYHTLRKDKADLKEIFVQVKLSVVKNRESFSEIVSRIAEYANTQNKVSISDLSSNKPIHIELEKLSRNIYAPHVAGQTNQTKWFYERARGQYKNARMKEGFTKARQKAFDFKNPRNQVFTKEDLAKYVNAYQEVYSGKKLIVGPHIVVRGNQKNYIQFINYNLIEKPDNIYFEDAVSKAIIFRAAEKLYGVKPRSIGDMRYLTVPYSISLLSYHTKNRVDLYKIWKNQCISPELGELMYELMVKVEEFIRETAAGSLYGEWAKKEECWNNLKRKDLKIDFIKLLKDDLEDSRNPSRRRRVLDAEIALVQFQEDLAYIKSVPAATWRKIEDWGRTTELLNEQQKTVAINLSDKVKNKTRIISDYEMQSAIVILDLVIDKAPEMFDAIVESSEQDPKPENTEISMELIVDILRWNRKTKLFREHEYNLMAGFETGKTVPTVRNLFFARTYVLKAKKYGFEQKAHTPEHD